MKNLITVALLCMSSVVVANPSAPAQADLWTNPRPDVQVSVVRGKAMDTYELSASISDLRTGQVLSEPKLIATPGKPAQVQVGATGAEGMISVEFTVTIADSGDTATYSSQVKDNGLAISSQSFTLAVAR